MGRTATEKRRPLGRRTPEGTRSDRPTDTVISERGEGYACHDQ